MPVEIKAYQQLASFRYIRNLERYKDEKPYMIAEADHVPENKRSNIELEWHDNVPVEDVRGRESDFTIEHNSFEFVKLGSSVPFPDAGSVSAYVESVAELLRQRLQADKVICYDTTVNITSSRGSRELKYCSIGKIRVTVKTHTTGTQTRT
jgi:hypothetical protein